MKRRNVLENDEAVSPVIATILMVAITVVLAATLYMMLPGADDAGTPVSGSISADYSENDGELTIDFDSMGTPSNPETDEIEIYIDGDEITDFTAPGAEIDNGDEHEWSFLTGDNEIRSGSSLTLTDAFADEIDENANEVTIFFDGYDGSLKANI